MSVRASSIRAFARSLWLFACLWLAPSPAEAWVETVVRSHHARVVVERDGRAEIRHELVVKLRGGPLEFFDVEGVGPDIEVLPDAVVRRAEPGSASMWPLEATANEGGTLRLKVLGDRGLRGGSFLFEFAYRVSLPERGWIAREPEGVRLSFVGPRLPTGVDAARVTFVVPRAELEPRLAPQEGAAAGILVGDRRRGAEADELELVRAHLAVGEPAVWQIFAASDAVALPAARASTVFDSPVPVVERALEERGFVLWHGLVAFLVALSFALAILFKGRALERLAAERSTRLRPLLPGSLVARVLLGGLGAGAACLACLESRPSWALGGAGLALLASTHLLPVRALGPRGPGRWVEWREPSIPKRRAAPGRWFDTSTGPGFLVFSALVLALGGIAYRVLAHSAYFALVTALGVVLLVPLFWTGRARDFPEPPEVQGARWFAFFHKRLDAKKLGLELWRRVIVPLEGTSEVELCDETRVRLLPRSPASGLRAFEIAFEEGAGAFVLPCVVVRVLEGSPADRRLASLALPWVRGRTAEERVAVVHPTAPTPRQTLRLVRAFLQVLSVSSATPSDASSISQPRGKGVETSNGAHPAPVIVT